MPFDLQSLIRASGYAGTAGQSFRNNVTGATTGVRMTDYIVSSWSFSGGPDPETTYASGHTFSLTVTFTQGNQAFNIKRTGDVMSFSANGGDSLVYSSSVASGSTGTTASLQVISRFNPLAQIDTSSTHFEGQIPGYFPPDTDPHSVIFEVGTATGAGTGTETFTIIPTYTPDNGPFNLSLNTPTFSVTMADRAATNSDFEVQWSSDGVNNDMPDGLEASVDQDHSGQDITVFYRWRFAGSVGSFSSWNPLSFDDPRDEV